MYSEAFDAVNNVVARNMDVENPNSMYNTIHNSEMFQQLESIKTQTGGGSNLPYFFSTGSDSQGSQNTTGLSVITNPENLFDGQNNTQASMALLSPNNTWSLLALDLETNYLSGTLSSSGTIFMGIVNNLSIPQGNYVMEDNEFVTLSKTGYFSDLSGQSLFKNGIIERNANLLINETLLFRYNIVGNAHLLSIGTKYSRLRNIAIPQSPSKIIFAVKNGTLNITKNIPNLSIDFFSSDPIDFDATDITMRVGLRTISENGVIAFNLTRESGNFYFGISDSSFYPSISISDQPFISPSSEEGYIFSGYSGNNQIKNGGTVTNVIGNYNASSSLKILHFKKRLTTAFTQIGEFYAGSSSNDYVFGAYSLGSSYTNSGTYKGFVIVSGGFSSISLNFQQYFNNFYDAKSGGYLFGQNAERFALYKDLGSNTAHYFEPFFLDDGSKSHYFTFNVNSSENVFFGIVDSSSTQNNSLSGIPVTVMHMNLNATGNIFGNGNNIGSSPGVTNEHSHLIYFSSSGSGTNATLRMGRSLTNSIQFIAQLMSGAYKMVIWTSGGSSVTSTLMTTVHRSFGNILV